MRKVRAYLEAAGFSTGAPAVSDMRALEAPPLSSANGKGLHEGAEEEEEPSTPTKSNGSAHALVGGELPSPSPSPSASSPALHPHALVASLSSSFTTPSSPAPAPTAPFPSLHILPGEHGAILTPLPSILRHVRLVARAVDEVERAAEAWEREED